MNELQIFKNDEFGTVRVVEINGEPWFVGMDIALALGYSNPHDALNKHVDDCDKGITKLDTLGDTQHMTIINEPGVYSLIFNNKLRKAKKFKSWVTSEVLPVIRSRSMPAIIHIASMYRDSDSIEYGLAALESPSSKKQVLVIHHRPDWPVGAWDTFDDSTISTQYKSKELARLASWPEESVNTVYESVVLAAEAVREMAKKAGWVETRKVANVQCR